MIPVAPLPLIVPLIYLSSFVAGIWLLVWLSLLAFSPRARQRLRRRWPSRGLLMLLLLIPLGLRAWLEIGLWQYERERCARKPRTAPCSSALPASEASRCLPAPG